MLESGFAIGRMTTQQENSIGEEDGVADENEKKSKFDAKKLLIGAGARMLFYPTVFINVLRNKIEPNFTWWDEIDQHFLFLGAVPFTSDVPRLKELGVRGVITLTEPFETLVSPSVYEAQGMDHLVIPTRDYLYAPSFDDIDKAVDFIHSNACCGRGTYVHCKAGRGRSTTIALCYLVKYKEMTPSTAMNLIRAKRPRVLLTSMQSTAVEQYYRRCFPVSESEELLVTEADFEGYQELSDNTNRNKKPSFHKASAKKLSSFVRDLKSGCSCVSLSKSTCSS